MALCSRRLACLVAIGLWTVSVAALPAAASPPKAWGCRHCADFCAWVRGETIVHCQQQFSMPQPVPYRSPGDGYYYFRPYNAGHVRPQQDFVSAHGLDPRNLADNRFFQDLYPQDKDSEELPPPKPESPEPAASTLELPALDPFGAGGVEVSLPLR